MLSCRKATALASTALDRPLMFRERVLLRGHVLICSSCRRATRQFRRLRTTVREAAGELQGGSTARTPLPEAARTRLDRELDVGTNHHDEPGTN